MIELPRIGWSTWLIKSQSVTGRSTTSPASHKPGHAVLLLAANSGLAGSTYCGSKPATRSAMRAMAARVTIISPIFKIGFTGITFLFLMNQRWTLTLHSGIVQLRENVFKIFAAAS